MVEKWMKIKIIIKTCVCMWIVPKQKLMKLSDKIKIKILKLSSKQVNMLYEKWDNRSREKRDFK